MANINVQLIGASLQVVDNTGTVTRVNSNLGVLLFAGTSSFYDSYYQVGTSPVSLTLPGTTVQVLYVRNLHATQTVTVTATPSGGASVTLGVLQPGGLVFYLNPGTTSGGYTAVSLSASGPSTPVELLLAG